MKLSYQMTCMRSYTDQDVDSFFIWLNLAFFWRLDRIVKIFQNYSFFACNLLKKKLTCY